MSSNIQGTPAASPSYWAQTTNFWNNKDNSTVSKVMRFVVAIFMYPFALLGDIAVKAGQLVFGKKEEATVELKWYQKAKQHAVDAKDWISEKHSDHKKVIWSVAGAALVAGLGYQYGGSALDAYRSRVPSWALGYPAATVTAATVTAAATTPVKTVTAAATTPAKTVTAAKTVATPAKTVTAAATIPAATTTEAAPTRTKVLGIF